MQIDVWQNTPEFETSLNTLKTLLQSKSILEELGNYGGIRISEWDDKSLQSVISELQKKIKQEEYTPDYQIRDLKNHINYLNGLTNTTNNNLFELNQVVLRFSWIIPLDPKADMGTENILDQLAGNLYTKSSEFSNAIYMTKYVHEDKSSREDKSFRFVKYSFIVFNQNDNVQFGEI